MKKLLAMLLACAGIALGQPTTPVNNARFGGTNLVLGTGSLGLLASTSGTLTFGAAATTTSYTFRFPANAGTSGYVLQTDGAGATSWVSPGSAGLPPQSGHAGQFLTTDGSNASWAAVSGTGTVTSVAQTFTGGLISVAGSPITTSGTLALTVAGTSGGIPYFSSGTTWASTAALGAGNILLGGGAGSPPTSLTAGATTTILVGGGAATAPVWTTATGSGSPVRGTSPSFTTNFTLANSATPSTTAVAETAFDTNAWASGRGAVQVHDGTASTYLVGVLASDTPTNGQVPKWNTGGTVTWEDSTAGSVTSVAVTGANGIGVSGSPITSSGTIALSLGDITPTSVAASGAVSGTTGTFSSLTSGRVPFVSTGGLLVDDADMTFATDTLTVTKGVFGGISSIANAITNANGVTAAAGSSLVLTGGDSGASVTVERAGLGPNVRVAANALFVAGTNAALSVKNTAGSSNPVIWQLEDIRTGVGRSYNIESGRTAGVFGIYDATASADRLTIDSSGNVVVTSGTFTAGTVTATASLVASTLLRVPNGASPSTTLAGQMAFDTDAWAASRGAIQAYDGTANTYVVAALASDTPSNGQVPTWNTGGTVTWETPATGSVTSVAQTFTGGLISVAGSPVTTTGTLALTVAGTSGGIPYFSSTSAWASSALLGANAIMIGGGAGAAPSTTTTGTGVLTAIGQTANTSGGIVTGNGTVTLSNKEIQMTAAHGTDDTFTGNTILGLNAGATIAQWETVYVGGSSTYLLADANGSGTYPAVGVAITSGTSSNPLTIMVRGTVRNDAWNWTPGGRIYLSTTAGGLTQTAPSSSGDKVQDVGFALTADIAYLDFNGVYLTVQ